uniref:Uncharacterized protein n=1 Tax=Romanomermis culicivorax TaxID=13658 RepID=A0A915KQY7_ROMCU
MTYAQVFGAFDKVMHVKSYFVEPFSPATSISMVSIMSLIAMIIHIIFVCVEQVTLHSKEFIALISYQHGRAGLIDCLKLFVDVMEEENLNFTPVKSEKRLKDTRQYLHHRADHINRQLLDAIVFHIYFLRRYGQQDPEVHQGFKASSTAILRSFWNDGCSDPVKQSDIHYHIEMYIKELLVNAIFIAWL